MAPGAASEEGSGSMDKDGNFNYQGTDGSSAGGSDGGSLTYTIDENGVVHYKMVEPDGKVTEWTSDGSITQ